MSGVARSFRSLQVHITAPKLEYTSHDMRFHYHTLLTEVVALLQEPHWIFWALLLRKKFASAHSEDSSSTLSLAHLSASSVPANTMSSTCASTTTFFFMWRNIARRHARLSNPNCKRWDVRKSNHLAAPFRCPGRHLLKLQYCEEPSMSSMAQNKPKKLQQQALFCNGQRTIHGHPRWHLQGGMAHTGPPGTWARFIWSGWVGFSICSCTQHRTLTKQLHCTVGCTCKHHSRSTNASTTAAAQLANLMRV